jgi:hypothetical protein
VIARRLFCCYMWGVLVPLSVTMLLSIRACPISSRYGTDAACVQEEIKCLLAIVNNDMPLYPGNYAKIMREFDTYENLRWFLRSIVHLKLRHWRAGLLAADDDCTCYYTFACL